MLTESVVCKDLLLLWKPEKEYSIKINHKDESWELMDRRHVNQKIGTNKLQDKRADTSQGMEPVKHRKK